MKSLKLAILLLLFALLASCAVESNSGMVIVAAIECGEDEYKPGKTPLRSYGKSDLVVTEILNSEVGYYLRLAAEHQGDEDYQNFSTFISEYFEIEYQVPEGWDEIPSYRIPISVSVEPGGSLTVGMDVLPFSIRKAMNENYEKNAYKNNQPYSLLRPTIGNCDSDDDCGGYKCVLESGVCANSCNLDVTSCAAGYRCDLGANNVGFCRADCRVDTGNTCQPLRDPNTNDVLMEYECVKEMCLPKNSTVNPREPDPVNLKIKLVGKNKNGSKVESAPYYFPISIGRENLLRFDEMGCYCSPIGDENAVSCFEDILEAFDEDCTALILLQDDYIIDGIQCAWFDKCYTSLCPYVLSK